MSSPNQSTKIVAEKEEESKLKAKYPQMQQRPGPQFLQKRLQKGQKFFDSGDYNMAKAAAAKGSAGKSRLSSETKLTSQQPSQQHPLPPCPNMANPPIPTPDCLATRKSSIHVPSKLVSGGP